MHRWAPGISGKSTLYRERPEKPDLRRKKVGAAEAEQFNSGSTLDLRCRQGATNFPIFDLVQGMPFPLPSLFGHRRRGKA